MASRSEESKPERGTEDAAKAGPSRRRPSADAVERALAEVSQTLERLKQVRAERAEAEARFKAEIQARTEEADELRQRLETLESTLGEERQARESAEARIDAARDVAEAEIERLQGELSKLQVRAEAAEQARESAEAQRRAEHDALVRERDEARAQIDSLRQSVAELERVREAQHEDRAALEQARAEAERLNAELAEVRESAESSNARLAELQQQIEQASEQHQAERREAERQAEALLAQLLAVENEADAERTALRSALEAAEARVAELQRDAGAGAEHAAENLRILENTVAQQREELESLRKEADTRAEEIEHQRAELARLGSELAEAHAEAGRLRTQADHNGGDAEALESLHAEKEALAAELEAERSQVRELTDKLDLAADRIDEMHRELESGGGSADAEASALREQLAEMAARLEAAERERDALRDPGRHASGDHDDDRLALRRARLRRARSLLREQRRKAARAEDLAAQRLVQCEEVLSRRRELVKARETIERAHKRVVGARARSGAAATLFFGLGVLGVLGGLSWAVVSRIHPATYAASGVIAAETGGDAPIDQAMRQWQEFHESLIFDPGLMARASERMAQRGFDELSHPAALKLTLEESLTWSAPEPGKLAFELLGKGREHTARLLDTYLTTVIAESGALRQRRAETSTTVLAEPVRAGVEPIADERPLWAAVGTAGGALFCLGIWFGVWKRMVRTKSAFENEAAVDHLLEDARWVDPIQKIIEAGGEDSRAA